MKQYIGLSGTSKEEKAINEMIEEARLRKYRKIYVLVPEFKTYMYEKKLAMLLGGTNTGIEVTSFSRLPNFIFKNTKYMNEVYINDVSKKLHLRNIIAELDLNLLKSEKNIDEISNLISKMKRNSVTLSELKLKYDEIISNSSSDIFKVKIDDIIQILEKYEEKISGFKDIDQKEEVLKEALENTDKLVKSKVYIMEFTNISYMQKQILLKLMQKAEDATLTVTLDKITTAIQMFEPSKEIALSALNSFGSNERIIEEFEDSLKVGKLKALNSFLTTNSPYDFSLENVLDNDLSFDSKSKPNSNSELENIEIYEFENKSDEIRSVASKVYNDLESGLKTEDIQILMNDVSSKKYAMEEEFSKYGINLDIKDSKKLSDMGLIQFLLNLLNSFSLDIPSIIQIIKSKAFKNLYIYSYINNSEFGESKTDRDIYDLKSEVMQSYEDYLFKFEKYISRWDISRGKMLNPFVYGKKDYRSELNISTFEVISFKNMLLEYINSAIEFILNGNKEVNLLLNVNHITIASELRGIKEKDKETEDKLKENESSETLEDIVSNIIKAEKEILQNLKVNNSKVKDINIKTIDVSKRLYEYFMSAKIFEVADPFVFEASEEDVVYDEINAEYESTINLLIQTFEDLSDEEEISINEYISAFNLAIEDKKVSSLPKSSSISVSEIQYANNSHAKTYILSMEEDITPQNIERVGIISEKENLELKRMDIVLYNTFEETENVNALNMYMALMSPKDKLILSYSKKDDYSGGDLIANTYINDISNYLEVNIEKEKHFSYIESFLGTNLPNFISKNIENSKDELKNELSEEMLNNILDKILKKVPNTNFALKEIAISTYNNIQKIYMNEDSKDSEASYDANYYNKNNNDYVAVLDKEKMLKILKYTFESILNETKLKDIYINALRENIPKNLPLDLVEKIYKKNIAMSVSKLEQYAAFPFAYHLKYILNINEARQLKIEALDTGNFIHEVLENIFEEIRKGKQSNSEASDVNTIVKLYEQLPKKKFNDLYMLGFKDENIKNDSEEYVNAVNNLTERITNETLKDSKYEIFTSTNKNKKLISKLLYNLKDVSLGVSETLRLSDYEILGNEVTIGLSKEVEDTEQNRLIVEAGKYTVEGHNVHLNGKIDRVDINSNNPSKIRIVDYKSSKRGLDIDKIINGLQLQLLVYSSILEKQLDKESKGLLYFSTNKDIESVKRSINNRDPKLINASTKMDGYLIASDENEAFEMDLDILPGENSEIVPAKINKKGGFAKSSKVLDSTEYEELKSKVDKKIESLVSDMLKGDVSISPYRYVSGNTSKESALTYCPYKMIHKFKVGENRYNYIVSGKNEKISEDERKRLDKETDL